MTVNVRIPASAVMNTALKSVNRWLTVLSRVDNGFPTGGVDYYTGFGDIESNFWLGLSPIYTLTNPAANGGHTYQLRVEMYSTDQAK